MKFLDHLFCVHAICFVICQVEYEIRTLKTFSLLMCNVFVISKNSHYIPFETIMWLLVCTMYYS